MSAFWGPEAPDRLSERTTVDGGPPLPPWRGPEADWDRPVVPLRPSSDGATWSAGAGSDGPLKRGFQTLRLLVVKATELGCEDLARALEQQHGDRPGARQAQRRHDPAHVGLDRSSLA
jgi:hypothetical protein